ncbi:LicD family protein [Actinomyces trachealis]|uniref:LicD family protein n=1 Tax=Actinomyces trachealis TaxID=2763540 RepID=UPI001FD52069|nr:LicD family protein [Actinomyces trachealis]
MLETLSLEEIKEVELGILRELDRVCKREGLAYFLAYGTLIGALRHKGFIPWDDDVDVYMPRPDYERLYQLAQAGALGPQFRIVSYRDRSSIYSFFKLVDTRTRAEESFITDKNPLGLWVDIFPLERVDISTPSITKAKRRASRLVWWRFLASTDPRYATSTTAKAAKWFIYPFTRLIDPYRVARKTDELARSTNLADGVATASTRYVLLVDDHMDKNTIRPDQLLPARQAYFEGYQFDVPTKAESILADYYGDWQQVPPKEDRPPSHLRAVTWVQGDADAQ